ncbi:MAG TPA: YihY/virulence factor BrkB family protein, partial [Cytophagales bacterium]|nr:YihY/virulence factor BrkB family protein [Cytophagales bacterium]
VLPDGKVKWKDAFVGAAFTGVFFLIGKFLIGLYLGGSNINDTYGSSGAIVLILLWVYYSSVILYFGAEFTKVYTRKYGKPIVPHDYAVYIEQKEIQIEPKNIKQQPTHGQ